MMKYGWAPAQEENNMFTRQEYIESLEATEVSSYLEKIDAELRTGKRFVSLGYLPRDAFPVIKRKITDVLENAGWTCEVAVSTCRDDEGVTYVRITN